MSPDGKSYWDGNAWRPVPQPQAPVSQPYYQPVIQQPVAQPLAPMTAGGRASNGIGTTAGILGIVSGVFMFIPVLNYLSVLLGVLAIIFGGIGIRRANQNLGAPKGMAVAGLVLGIVSVAIALVFIIGVYAYLFRSSAPWI